MAMAEQNRRRGADEVHGQLNEYLGFFDKVEKRLRNEQVTEAFAQIFAHEGKDSARRVDFESPAKLKEMRGGSRSW
jgi:DNA gyrase subunit B